MQISKGTGREEEFSLNTSAHPVTDSLDKVQISTVVESEDKKTCLETKDQGLDLFWLQRRQRLPFCWILLLFGYIFPLKSVEGPAPASPPSAPHLHRKGNDIWWLKKSSKRWRQQLTIRLFYHSQIKEYRGWKVRQARKALAFCHGHELASTHCFYLDFCLPAGQDRIQEPLILGAVWPVQEGQSLAAVVHLTLTLPYSPQPFNLIFQLS